MNRNLTLVLFAVVVLVLVVALARILRPAPQPEDTRDTEAIVSRLIAQDPLIAPTPARRGATIPR